MNETYYFNLCLFEPDYLKVFHQRNIETNLDEFLFHLSLISLGYSYDRVSEKFIKHGYFNKDRLQEEIIKVFQCYRKDSHHFYVEIYYQVDCFKFKHVVFRNHCKGHCCDSEVYLYNSYSTIVQRLMNHLFLKIVERTTKLNKIY